jgi:hypothetical protein
VAVFCFAPTTLPHPCLPAYLLLLPVLGWREQSIVK